MNTATLKKPAAGDFAAGSFVTVYGANNLARLGKVVEHNGKDPVRLTLCILVLPREVGDPPLKWLTHYCRLNNPTYNDKPVHPLSEENAKRWLANELFSFEQSQRDHLKRAKEAGQHAAEVKNFAGDLLPKK